MTETEPIKQEPGAPAIPLDRRENCFFIDMFPTLVMMLFAPFKAFRRDEYACPSRALGFAVVIPALVLWLLYIAWSGEPGPMALVILFLVSCLISSALVAMFLLFMFIAAAQLSLSLTMVRWARGIQTTRVICYAWGGYTVLWLFYKLPFFEIWANAWLGYMVLCGLKKAHGIAWWRAGVVTLTLLSLVAALWQQGLQENIAMLPILPMGMVFYGL